MDTERGRRAWIADAGTASRERAFRFRSLAEHLFPLALLAAAMLAATSAPARAQDPEPSAEEQRAALNREQAELARRQLEENAANQRAYEDAMRARDIEAQSQQDEYARLRREHEEAMARWRADAAACKAGDLQRCGG